MKDQKVRVQALLEPGNSPTQDRQFLRKLEISNPDCAARAFQEEAAFSHLGRLFVPQLLDQPNSGCTHKKCEQCHESFWASDSQKDMTICLECSLDDQVT